VGRLVELDEDGLVAVVAMVETFLVESVEPDGQSMISAG